VYLRHFHGSTFALQICRFQMMYFTRGSLEATIESAIFWASHPFFGSWVMSRAVTTPILPSMTQGLWSELRL
jgi:uncharacterized membrane protein YfbV (UPF0208 family)